MTVSWSGIIVFTLIASSALALIAVCDEPPGQILSALPTGGSEPFIPTETSSEGTVTDPSMASRFLIEQARELGDARLALDLLRAKQAQVRDPANLARVAFLLEEELYSPAEAAGRLELIGETIPALVARRSALATLADDRAGRMGPQEAVRLLRSIEMNERGARELEAFFLHLGAKSRKAMDLGALCAAECAPDRLAAVAMVSAGGRAGSVAPEDALILAEHFRLAYRPRARMRWLLRAFEADPTSSETALALSEGCLDAGLREGALLVLSTAARAGATDITVQKRRAEIAAWLSRYEEELEALEGVLGDEEEPLKVRRRLIELYRYLGRPDEASLHVAELARAAGDATGLGEAADLALSGGDLELAVELFEEASTVADDPRPWRERLVEFYLQDLQVDAALAELKNLAERWPEGGYDDRRYDLLKRANRQDELAEILLLRLQTDPDPELEAEAMALCLSLGRIDQVRTLMVRRVERAKDPLLFFRGLKAYAGAGIEGLLDKATLLSKSPELDAEEAAEILAVVAEMDRYPGYEAIATDLMLRFPALYEKPAPVALGEFEGPDVKNDWVPWLAERFFAAGWLDLSLVLYESLAEESPDEAKPWTRIGQIASWSNDPYGAIVSFERALAVGGDGEGELLFYLGEAYWSCRQEDLGRTVHEQALVLLRETGFASVPRSSMEARILARFGREEESRAIFDRLLALVPGNQDLLLDYADALVILNRKEAARRVVEQARLLGAESPRALRMDAQLKILEGRYEEALAGIDRAIELYGEDPGYAASSAEAFLGLGRLARARDAFDELLSLQPENRTARETRRVLGDQLASPVADLLVRTETAADDRMTRMLLSGSLLLDAEETRVSGYLERAAYRGRAQAFRNGLELLDTELTSLGISASRRLSRDWELALGADFYPDRPGGDPLGGWIEVSRREQNPYARYELRLHVLETLAYPAAAAGLDGRSSGVELTGYRSGQDADWWAYGRLRYSNLSIETARDGRLSNDVVILEGSFGTWFRGEGPQVQEGLLARRAEPARTGSTVAGEPPESRGPRIGAWVGYAGMALLDGAELADSLPILDVAHYVTATGRLEESLGPGLVVEVEAYLGTDLGDPSPGPFGGALLGLSWRPGPDFEVGFRGTYGYAFGRADVGKGASSLELRFTLRW